MIGYCDRDLYAFGSYKLDPTNRLLFEGARRLELSDNLLKLLTALLEAQGSVVDAETLAERVWGSRQVSKNNIVQHVHLLRSVLGDNSKKRTYIESIPRRGYRFLQSIQITKGAFPSQSLSCVETLLRASISLGRQDGDGLVEAIRLLERLELNAPKSLSIALSLARAYSVSGELGYCRPRLAYGRAKDAVDLAVAIDPFCAEAHAIRARMTLLFKRDYSAGIAAMAEARRLNNKSPAVLMDAAWLNLLTGVPRRAVETAYAAAELEPNSALIQHNLIRIMIFAGECAGALTLLGGILRNNSGCRFARRFRALGRIVANEPNRAIDDLLTLPMGGAEYFAARLPLLAVAYAKLGQHRKAQELYANLVRARQDTTVSASQLAIVASYVASAAVVRRHISSARREGDPGICLIPYVRSSGLSRIGVLRT